jgi:hypothetical protein
MIKINRAPVLTLWAAAVAERLGFDHDEALTLGRAVAGLSAQAKGRRLGIFEPSPENLDQKRKEHGPDEVMIEFMQRHVPVIVTADGIRATTHGKAMSPPGVEKYIAGKFGTNVDEARAAMIALAKSIPVRRRAPAPDRTENLGPSTLHPATKPAAACRKYTKRDTCLAEGAALRP